MALAAIVVALGTAVGLATRRILRSRLERVSGGLGLSEALLGIVEAVAAGVTMERGASTPGPHVHGADAEFGTLCRPQ